jgi:hypothetical protein
MNVLNVYFGERACCSQGEQHFFYVLQPKFSFSPVYLSIELSGMAVRVKVSSFALSASPVRSLSLSLQAQSFPTLPVAVRTITAGLGATKLSGQELENKHPVSRAL